MEGAFLDPDIPDGERTTYRGLVGGEPAGEGEVLIERVEQDGRELYRQSLTVRVGKHAELRATTLFQRRRGTIHADSHHQDAFDGSSTEDPVASEHARFRGVNGLQWGGRMAAYPRDLTPALGGALALRGLAFAPGEQRSFTVWLAGGLIWTVEARVEQRESIELPAGAFEAWRVRLRPSLEEVDRSLDRLFDIVVPPVLIHLAAEPPHRLLRFAFPSGPFKENPPAVIEATALD